MKRILVTGGAGFIGSHTCAYLLENGYEICVLDSLSHSDIKSLNKIKQIFSGKNINYDDRLKFFKGALLKIKGTDIQQAVTELAMEAVGYYANPHLGTTLSNEYVGPDYATNLSGTYFNFRKASIYGGSNEIQRNIIAKMVLGL